MAGHLRHDPALDRWAAMRENVYQHFKFTRTATRHVLTWGIAVPALIAVCAVKFDDKYDWAGKLRGQSLLRETKDQKQAEQ